MNRPVVVAGTAGAAVTALAIGAVTWGWWRELVGRAVDEVTIDLTGLGGDDEVLQWTDGTIPQAVLDQMSAAHEEFAVRNERLMAWLAAGVVNPDEIRHYYAEGGGVHGGRADLAAAGEGLGASLDLGGEVSGSPTSEPLADRIRAKIAEIDADLAKLRERQPSAYRKTSASHHIAGARIVLRQILAVLDEQ